VRLALTVSSGVAIYPQDARHGPIEDNPYGFLKREAEHRLAEAAAESGAVPVVARAWSISGAHVQKPQGYALGSMIRDANAGAIRIMARRPVFRRYVLAEELLALGIAEGVVGPATIDSGGELVEMGELAARVAAVVRPDTVISRDEVDPRDPDRYHSDGHDWEQRCRRWDLASAPFDRQIEISRPSGARRCLISSYTSWRDSAQLASGRLAHHVSNSSFSFLSRRQLDGLAVRQ
jgi:hypothetical protein